MELEKTEEQNPNKLLWELMSSQTQMMLSLAETRFLDYTNTKERTKPELWIASNATNGRSIVVASKDEVGAVGFAHGNCIGYTKQWISTQRVSTHISRIYYPLIEQILSFGEAVLPVKYLEGENVAFPYMTAYDVGHIFVQRVSPFDVIRKQILRMRKEEIGRIKVITDAIFQARMCMLGS